MGFKADLFRLAQTFDGSNPYEPGSKILRRHVLPLCCDSYTGDGGTTGHINHIRSYTNGNRTGGTFDFTVTIDPGLRLTNIVLSVSAVDWNSTGAALASLLDNQAVANVEGYFGGGITATGQFGSGGSTVEITINDSLLAGNTTYSLDGTNLTGGTTDPALGLQQTEGMVPRVWMEALYQLGVITGSAPSRSGGPASYAAPTPYVSPATQRRDQVGQYPSQEVIRLLVRELEFVEGHDYSWVLDPQ